LKGNKIPKKVLLNFSIVIQVPQLYFIESS
jgi:hypothetical protein